MAEPSSPESGEPRTSAHDEVESFRKKYATRTSKLRRALQILGLLLPVLLVHLALLALDASRLINGLVTLGLLYYVTHRMLAADGPAFAAEVRAAMDQYELKEVPQQQGQLLGFLALAVLLPFVQAPLGRDRTSDLPGWWYGVTFAAAVIGSRLAWAALYSQFGPEPVLWRAVMNRNLRSVRRLLAAGADVEELDPNGNAPIAWPVYRADSKLLRLLLDAGADPNVSVYAYRQSKCVRVTLHEIAERQLAFARGKERRRWGEIVEMLTTASRQQGVRRFGSASD